jgi:hypothetical protein
MIILLNPNSTGMSMSYFISKVLLNFTKLFCFLSFNYKINFYIINFFIRNRPSNIKQDEGQASVGSFRLHCFSYYFTYIDNNRTISWLQ